MGSAILAETRKECWDLEALPRPSVPTLLGKFFTSVYDLYFKYKDVYSFNSIKCKYI